MNTIADYLETMFINLPETPEIMQLKYDLYANMEDKYNELKVDGKSENEAIGVVISEFGNIDEILEEMNVHYQEEEEESIPVVDLTEALSYVEGKKRIGLGIGVGVFLCALGLAAFLLIAIKFNSPIGIIPMIVSVAIGVGLFIISGYKNSAFQYFQGDFVMTGASRKVIQNEKHAYERTHILAIVLGVAACILSVVPFFMIVFLRPFDNGLIGLGIGLILVIASIGVIFLVYTGNVILAFNTLLRNAKPRQPTKEEIQYNRVDHLFEAVYWPLIVIIYLVWSFTGSGMRWSYSWIIFAVAGILQEAIKAILGIAPTHKKH
ncbi:permease prefix domain 1-containing protein [uncultured Vagococcus sp.]|uniref:permease prefix domain 1-containing protein n=1 Tax=uncultured Vagococcus sp. TaxID=189676 RepID=UPI0028D154C4|nr:permease prefix domain 1-containing protein [uncultured Vagococcus sp.]